MYNYVDAVSDYLIHSRAVADVGFDKLEILILQTAFNIPAFDSWVVKVIEIINADQPSLRSRSLRCEPIKPAAPVINTFIRAYAE
ncbi:MAG: hypothetical protein ACYSTG_01610 [Planctomycetota bacterium]|jgi:hypothetical protein